MEKLTTMELADELAEAQDKILNSEAKLDTGRVTRPSMIWAS